MFMTVICFKNKIILKVIMDYCPKSLVDYCNLIQLLDLASNTICCCM
jgi:hypothetical protein